MRNAIHWIAIVLLQATIPAAGAQNEFGQSAQSTDQGRAMPTSDFQPVAALDTQNSVTRSPGVDWNGSRGGSPRGETGPIAQGFGATSTVANNVKAQTGDPENPTLAAIKALHEEIKSLETRIAAQDARIAMLERALESYTARNR
jgi:hypothetical protein